MQLLKNIAILFYIAFKALNALKIYYFNLNYFLIMYFFKNNIKKISILRLNALVTLKFTLIVFLLGIDASAFANNSIEFDPNYSIRINDMEAGFYYFERLVQTSEGYVLETGMELHDNKTMGRFGCEQTMRMVFVELVENGILGGEELDEPMVEEEAFYEYYKNTFLRYVENIRPYSDLRDFFSESLMVWHGSNCIFMNRFESNPTWFLNLPSEKLLINESGAPQRRSIQKRFPGLTASSDKVVQYDENQIVFNISTEGYDDIHASTTTTGTVFDPLQINMIVASFDYHEGFRQSLRFKNLYVDVPYYEEWREDGPKTEISAIEATVSVKGSMFLPVKGEEMPVWAVEVRGFEPVSYHPLFHLYDNYHRNFGFIRYYICKSEGNILMMETLTSGERPTAIYYAE